MIPGDQTNRRNRIIMAVISAIGGAASTQFRANNNCYSTCPSARRIGESQVANRMRDAQQRPGFIIVKWPISDRAGYKGCRINSAAAAYKYRLTPTRKTNLL